MIKVIAFDFVGVLVKEKDILLRDDFSQMERLFGPNKSDIDYLSQVKLMFSNKNNTTIIKETKEIIDSIYELKVSKDSLLNLKNTLNNISFVIATNHVSFVEDYILDSFDKDTFSKIFISANIGEIKPNKAFFDKIINALNILPNEILFLDDNLDNISAARNIGINTIKIQKTDDVLKKTEEYFNC